MLLHGRPVQRAGPHCVMFLTCLSVLQLTARSLPAVHSDERLQPLLTHLRYGEQNHFTLCFFCVLYRSCQRYKSSPDVEHRRRQWGGLDFILNKRKQIKTQWKKSADCCWGLLGIFFRLVSRLLISGWHENNVGLKRSHQRRFCFLFTQNKCLHFCCELFVRSNDIFLFSVLF